MLPPGFLTRLRKPYDEELARKVYEYVEHGECWDTIFSLGTLLHAKNRSHLTEERLSLVARRLAEFTKEEQSHNVLCVILQYLVVILPKRPHEALIAFVFASAESEDPEVRSSSIRPLYTLWRKGNPDAKSEIEKLATNSDPQVKKVAEYGLALMH